MRMHSTLYGIPVSDLITYFGASTVARMASNPSPSDFDQLAEYEIAQWRHCRIGKVTHKPSLNYQAVRSI